MTSMSCLRVVLCSLPWQNITSLKGDAALGCLCLATWSNTLTFKCLFLCVRRLSFLSRWTEQNVFMCSKSAFSCECLALVGHINPFSSLDCYDL